MTTTDHMTGAELQTLREAAGLSRELFAALIDVEARTVKHWETRKGAGVPADAAALARRLVQWVIDTSEAGASQVREAISEHGASEVVLMRHRFAQSLPQEDRDACLMPEVHGAMVSRLALMLMAQAVPVRVIWFDPEDFNAWRDKLRKQAWGARVDLLKHYSDLIGKEVDPYPDTPAARIAWAAGAIAAQAIPHPGDQPPPGHTPGA